MRAGPDGKDASQDYFLALAKIDSAIESGEYHRHERPLPALPCQACQARPGAHLCSAAHKRAEVYSPLIALRRTSDRRCALQGTPNTRCVAACRAGC